MGDFSKRIEPYPVKLALITNNVSIRKPFDSDSAINMKILIVFARFRGGTGRVVTHLARVLSANHDVAILGTKDAEQNFSCPENVQNIIFDCQKDSSESLIHYIWKRSKGIRKTILDFKPDVVVSFLSLISTLVCISLFTTRVPIIVSERSNPLQEHHGWKFNLLRFIAYHRADLIVVQNRLFASFYKSYFKKKTVAIPNPVPTRTRKKDVHTVISAPRIIALGNLSPWKKYDRMINLFSKFHESYNDAVLTIYGDGVDRNRLNGLIKQLKLDGHVFLPGHISDIDKIFSDADIFWMTSEREGFPNALCEAMSAGLPCVMFECHAGLREIIQNGVNGFLIPYDDDNEFVKTTERLCRYKSLRNGIEESATEISERYKEDIVVKMWEKTICDLVEESE